MKSLRLFAIGDLRLLEEPAPIPSEHEKLVRVKTVGICGSDLHWFAEGGIGDVHLERPLVLGHEFAGETETGQIVAVDPSISCDRCEYCLQGHPNLCPGIIFAGHGNQDGGLRQWVVWDEKKLVPLPDSFSAADGAMLEPLGIALHTVDLGKLRAGVTVGVFGCGPIGLLIVQIARLMGATSIIATDVLPHRLEAARAYGATHAFLAEASAELSSILAVGNGRGVDVAFEAAGEQAAVNTAIAAVKPGGKVVLAGIPADDQTTFTASIARRKGLTIKLVRRMKHAYPRAIDLVSKGLVDVRSLITHRFPFERALDAFQTARRRDGLKVIVEL